MSSGPIELKLYLGVILEHAAALREAGVTRVQIVEAIAFDLSPSEPKIEILPPEADEAEEMDPLMDPATYGRRDGTVPGFPRQPKDEDDE